MNVLYLINHAGQAGSEGYVHTLIENAPAFGYRPFFAYNEPGLLLERVGALGVECVRLDMRGPFDLAAARRLAGVCRERGIGLVHTHYLRENYIALLAKRLYVGDLKVVYTNHFVIPNSLPIRMANRLMTRGNHRIIAISEACALRLVKNGNARDKITTIYHAVDPSVWNPGLDYEAIRAKTRGQYGLDAGDVVFLCASRFSEEKGHGFLLDSLARCVAKGAAMGGGGRLRVLLAGDGPLQDEVRARVADLGLADMVRFVGFARDIRPLLYASDACVNPSRHEALGFIILEALAAGLPVIASGTGGSREVISERNNCGIHVRYGDVEGMAAALAVFMTDERLAKKANALGTIDRQFALPAMLEKTFATYR